LFIVVLGITAFYLVERFVHFQESRGGPARKLIHEFEQAAHEKNIPNSARNFQERLHKKRQKPTTHANKRGRPEGQKRTRRTTIEGNWGKGGRGKGKVWTGVLRIECCSNKLHSETFYPYLRKRRLLNSVIIESSRTNPRVDLFRWKLLTFWANSTFFHPRSCDCKFCSEFGAPNWSNRDETTTTAVVLESTRPVKKGL